MQFQPIQSTLLGKEKLVFDNVSIFWKKLRMVVVEAQEFFGEQRQISFDIRFLDLSYLLFETNLLEQEIRG